MNRCLFIDFDYGDPARIPIAITRPGLLPEPWAWRPLPIAVAVLQVRAFVHEMEEGDSVIHHPRLPEAILDELEGEA